MDEKVKKYLFDVIESINNIEEYLEGNRDFKKYDAYKMLQDAVERNLEIIGEAINRVLQIEPEIQITNSRRIVDARNIIIHAYDGLDNAQIWAIIVNHLPKLKVEVNMILNA